jgi:hypothetical protein
MSKRILGATTSPAEERDLAIGRRAQRAPKGPRTLPVASSAAWAWFFLPRYSLQPHWGAQRSDWRASQRHPTHAAQSPVGCQRGPRRPDCQQRAIKERNATRDKPERPMRGTPAVADLVSEGGRGSRYRHAPCAVTEGVPTVAVMPSMSDRWRRSTTTPMSPQQPKTTTRPRWEDAPTMPNSGAWTALSNSG